MEEASLLCRHNAPLPQHSAVVVANVMDKRHKAVLRAKKHKLAQCPESLSVERSITCSPDQPPMLLVAAFQHLLEKKNAFLRKRKQHNLKTMHEGGQSDNSSRWMTMIGLTVVIVILFSMATLPAAKAPQRTCTQQRNHVNAAHHRVLTSRSHAQHTI